jgi:type IV pilus assembly protein PilF
VMRWLARTLMVVVMCAATGCSTTASGPMQSNPKTAADLNAQLGLAYMQKGNNEEALKKLKHALELNPDSASANHFIAELYRKLGKSHEAETHYRKAMSLTPSDPMLLNNYGVFLCSQGRLGEAVKKFLAAVKQPFYKTPEVAYANAGLCALQIPDTAKAEEYFRSALRLNPRMPDALYELADLNFKQQKYLHARAFVQRYLDVAEPNPQILWLAVRVERKLGDEAAAAEYAEQLKERFPTADETVLSQERHSP